MSKIFRIFLVVYLSMLVCACSLDELPAPISLSATGFIPERKQRPGDPNKGYSLLINYPYITCGVPATAFKKLNVQSEEAAVLAGRTGRNRQFPYQYTAFTDENGVELVVSNCLTCHAARFNDELIIGLGNESMDMTRDISLNAERVGAFIHGGHEARAWKKWADRVEKIAPYIRTRTVGVNSANNMTFILMAHREPDSLAWTPKPMIMPPPKEPLPVSVPPWWRMKKKHAMFYDASGRGDHARIMMLASTLCTDSNEEARVIDQQFVHIRAYLKTMNAPRYPFDIDASKAKTGETVFNNTCSRCHGRYGDDWHYPNLVIPIAEIGTDSKLAAYATGPEGRRFIRWFENSFYGEIADIAPAQGYVAPPLDGVWATAPFLHNGSVPSIALLLKSDERPKYWKRDFSQKEFNQTTLGWNFIELNSGQSNGENDAENRWIYDTTRNGYGNHGHDFGDHLTADQRMAILEYLKML